MNSFAPALSVPPVVSSASTLRDAVTTVTVAV